MKALIRVTFNVRDADRPVAFYRSLGFATRGKWRGTTGPSSRGASVGERP